MAEIRIKRQVVGAGQVGIDLSGDAVQVGGAVEYESSWLIERSGTQLCYSQDASSCQAWVTFTESRGVEVQRQGLRRTHHR